MQWISFVSAVGVGKDFADGAARPRGGVEVFALRGLPLVPMTFRLSFVAAEC